jgi:hypothetical protein
MMLKYKDPVTKEFKNISVGSAESIPAGTILEYSGSTVPEGYELVSDVEIEMPKLYSTEEGAVGRWIDDKTIYRKVVDIPPSLITAPDVGIPVNLLDCDTMISQNVFWYDSQASRWRTLPGNYYMTNDWDGQTSFDNVRGWLFFEMGANFYTRMSTKATKIYAVLEYTKTTV